MVSTMRPSSSGPAGHPPSWDRSERIGIVLQSAGLDAELTVREVLVLYAASYPRSLPVTDVIALVGLEDKHRARVKTLLSGGQRRRRDLALALVGDPDLVFLDEPTTGFDPAARRGAWRLVENLRGLGRTIVLTSHYMDEVQHLADRAVVITNGRIVAEGAPDALGR
jgi:ABC-2 type transport system ATP-binding protein